MIAQGLRRHWESEQYRSTLILLLLLAATVILAGIGLRDPWPSDEPRFAEIAREMVATGQWMFPSRGGEFYPDKPPVFMWSIAAFYWLTGNLNLAFLLPSALCGLLTVYLIFDIGTRLWDVKTGRNAALLMLIAPQFVLQAKTAQIDMMVTAWIVIGCYGLLRHFFVGKHWGWYFIAWAFMGFGVITKGVGFLPALMMIPIIVLALSKRSDLSGRLTWLCLLGPVAMLAAVALWGLPMLYQVMHSADPDLIAYRDNILFKQTGERYSNPWHHHKPWHYFFVSVIPLFWFPLPLLVLAKWRNIKESLAEHPVQWVLAGYVVLVLTFFSLSPGKRGVYIFPALPMLALMLAPVMTRASLPRWFDWGLNALMGVLTLVFAVATVGLFAEHESVAKVIDGPLIGFALLGLTITLSWAAIQWWRRRKETLPTFGAALAATWLLYSLWGMPLINGLRTPRGIMEKTAAAIGADGQLGLIKFKEQIILFSPVPISHFGYLTSTEQQSRNAWAWMRQAPNRYLLLPRDAQTDCIDKERARSMGFAHRREWLLVDRQALAKHCSAPEKVRLYHSPNQVWRPLATN